MAITNLWWGIKGSHTTASRDIGLFSPCLLVPIFIDAKQDTHLNWRYHGLISLSAEQLMLFVLLMVRRVITDPLYTPDGEDSIMTSE
jgi:hypothetical protein